MELFKKKRVAHVSMFPDSICIRPDLKQIQKADAKLSSGESATTNGDDGKAEQTLPKPKVLMSGSIKNKSPLPSKSLHAITKAMKFSETLQPRNMELRKLKKRKNLNETKLYENMKLKAERIVFEQNESCPKKARLSVGIEDIQPWLQDVEDLTNPAPHTFLRPSGLAMDWDVFLQNENNLHIAPPVEFFKSAPLAKIWKKIAKVGLAIELRNPFIEDQGDVFWIGIIVHYTGYRALVQFETMGTCPSGGNYLTWISFCSNVPKPLGWCGRNNKELMPGPIVSPDIAITDFQSKLAEFYKNPTIDENHYKNLIKEIDSLQTLDHRVPIEALDIDCFKHNRLGRISAIFGNRAHVQYYPKESDKGFWFNYNSESLHPFGWSHSVGVHLNAIDEGVKRTPLTAQEFPHCPKKIEIKVGMWLETRHPFLPFKIVGAIITKVLKHGYFIIRTMDVEKIKREYFVYHVTSHFIFPAGFGAEHGIRVEFGDSKTSADNLPKLRLDRLPRRPPHSFQVGHKLEAVDVLDGWFIGPATIKKIAGHLLYLHFDNWKDCFAQNYVWVDTENSDIYPVGYCEMLGLQWRGSVAV